MKTTVKLSRRLAMSLIIATAFFRADAQQIDLGGVFRGISDGTNRSSAPVRVVNYRELKKLLPSSFRGLTRTSIQGEKQSTMGITASTASATYEDQSGNTAEIKLTDVGSLSGIAALAYAGWADMDIDQETDRNFERTVMYDGFKAMERFDGTQRFSEIQVLVGERFTLEAKGYGIDFALLRQAVQSFDLQALSRLQ